MAHQNEEITRNGYAAFTKGDMDGVAALLAPEVVWHVLGRNVLSGDYHGVDQTLQFLGRLVEATEGTLRLDIHDVLANDEHAVALVHLRADRAGRTYDANETHITHIRDGRITEFWAVSTDQQAWDELLKA
jgi:ketosteroid isomerase-like protein